MLQIKSDITEEHDMNYAAYEILSLIDECEGIDHPEMIPSPERVRQDPEFSIALDFLLEKEYIEICEARHSEHHDVELGIELGMFDPRSDSLTITPTGIFALEKENMVRVNLREY